MVRYSLSALLLLCSCEALQDQATREWLLQKGCDRAKEICQEETDTPTPVPPTPPVQPPPSPPVLPPTPEPVEPTPEPTRPPKPEKPEGEGDCSLLRFGDGRGGNLFLKSETQRGWKFLAHGCYGKPKKIFFCSGGKCSKPNPDYPACGGFANPDGECGGRERWHSCTPGPAEEIRIDDCKPLKPSKKCLKKKRCD